MTGDLGKISLDGYIFGTGAVVESDNPEPLPLEKGWESGGFELLLVQRVKPLFREKGSLRLRDGHFCGGAVG